jgi:hypothetical protein
MPVRISARSLGPLRNAAIVTTGSCKCPALPASSGCYRKTRQNMLVLVVLVELLILQPEHCHWHWHHHAMGAQLARAALSLSLMNEFKIAGSAMVHIENVRLLPSSHNELYHCRRQCMPLALAVAVLVLVIVPQNCDNMPFEE